MTNKVGLEILETLRYRVV